MIDRIVNAVVGLMGLIGAPGAAIAVALESIFPPIPSEVVLPLAGFAAARGEFSLLSVIIWTTVGSLVGALVLYWLGHSWGIDRLRRQADRLPLMRSSDIDKTVAWFARHGRSAVFFGRMVPGFRSFISIPAGVENMPLWRFSLYTTGGSLIWNSVLIVAGYELGANWHLVQRYADVVSTAVVVLVAGLVGWFVVHRLREGRQG